MRLSLILLYLLCTAAQAQTVKDSLNCYTLTESRVIASRVTWANSCDSLLQDTKDQLSNQSKVISNDSLIIRNKDIAFTIQGLQLSNRDYTISGLSTSLKETKVTASVIILGLLTVLILHK